MTSSRYPIPAATKRAEIKVLNSRFVATAGEAASVEAAKAFVAAVRREFHDATHHVFAYRIGYGGSIVEGMSDDGEPPGTAARPALTVLRGADLGDVVLVITRYFGGTKLGTGGLVRAYTQAAQQVLSELPRTERVERRAGEIIVSYNLYSRVKQLLAQEGGEIASEEFGGEIRMEFNLPVDAQEQFEKALTGLSLGRIGVSWDE